MATAIEKRQLKLSQRVKTGDFAEEFAREADKLRNREHTTLSQPKSSSHTTGHAKRNIQFQFPWLRRPIEDEERPGEEHMNRHGQDDLCHLRRIPISCIRAPTGGDRNLFILGMADRAESITSREDEKTLRWLHIQHLQGESFRKFVDIALDESTIVENARSMLRDWLEEIHQNEAKKIYGGKAFPSLVRQRVLTSASGITYDSVFFAVPYFMLDKLGRSVTDNRYDAGFHPTRALVQSSYRIDSPFSREKFQAIRRVWEHLDEDELIFIPQLWGLVVGDNYLVTCAPSQLNNNPANQVVLCPMQQLPPFIRVRLDDVYYFKLEDCPSWFSFLSHVQAIYRYRWGNIHVIDSAFVLDNTRVVIDGQVWLDFLNHANKPGSYNDITLHLVPENTQSNTYTKTENEEFFVSGDRSDPYIRVKRAYLMPEILIQFKIPWEWDKRDPNYIIIKRFIDENTQEALFYHTRQYRQQQASKGGLDIKIEEGNSASEYNKTGDHEVPRDEADSTEERDTNNDSPFWNLSADFVDIISKSSDMLASGVEYAQGAMEWNREDASNNSTEPLPFLCWRPITLMQIGSQTASDGMVTKRPDVLQDNTTKSPFALVNVKSLLHYLHVLCDKHEAYAMLPSGSKRALDEVAASLSASIGTGTSRENGFCRYGVDICQDAPLLINNFIPENFNCRLKEKFFGGLEEVLKIGLSNDDGHGSWIIKICTEVKALLDLTNKTHFGLKGCINEVPLLTAHIEALRKLCVAIGSLYLWRKNITEAHEIPSTPAEAHNLDLSGHSVPIDPIEEGTPLESVSQSCDYQASARNSAQSWTTTDDDGDDEDDARTERSHQRDLHRLVLRPLQEIVQCLYNSQKSIIDFLDKQNPRKWQDFLPVTSPYIAATIVQHLCLGVSKEPHPEGFQLEEVYQEYYSQLRLAVREKPSRLLLDDLDRLDEELDCIRTILKTQIKFVNEFLPSFDNEDTRPNSTFNEPVWKTTLEIFQKGLQDKDELCKELNDNTEKLRKQVSRQLDFKQDSNSKAILVFTIVTIIFLPLSFITGYLGMNTNDIRNMDQNQPIFWEIAVPFTVLVVSFCVLLAYRGAVIQEALVQIVRGDTMRDLKRKRQ